MTSDTSCSRKSGSWIKGIQRLVRWARALLVDTPVVVDPEDARTMMTPPELKRFIRFALSLLTDENGFHAFEQIAGAITIARISRNAIPATGPVGAGGDQGRDGETIPRYDGQSDAAGILGDLSAKTVVYVCNLWEDRVETKIVADVASATNHDDLPVDVIVAFCKQSVPVGVRNKLKQKAKKAHNVELHIVDGNAIAELLAAHDLNWVAHKYLDLPTGAAPAPRSDEDDAWYLNQRLKWAERQAETTWGDLEDLRRSARYAYQQGLDADTPFWIELLEPLAADGCPFDIRRAAVYEISLAHLRGQQTLVPSAADIGWYFDTIADVHPSASLEDAQGLLMFCFGAVRHAIPGVTGPEVRRWRDTLTSKLERAIDETDNPARLYSLLTTRGALELIRDAPPTFGQVRHWWDQALKHADAATMLPVDVLADRLPPVASMFAHDLEFAEFAERVDTIAARQGGDGAAAEQAIARANALLKDDRLVPALPELHRAKHRLMAAHEMTRFVGLLLVIGEVYKELGLFLAAKQYFLAATALAVNSSDPNDRRFVARGLEGASECDYMTGAWLGFLSLARAATSAHGLLDVDAGDPEEHPFLQSLGYHLVVMAVAARYHYPIVADRAEGLARWHLGETFDRMLDNPPRWVTKAEEFRAAVADQSHSRPFDDAGESRTIAWTAHGITWLLEAGPDTRDRAAAERLAAAIQVLQADLATVDYVPLPISVIVHVEAGAMKWEEIGPSELSALVPRWDPVSTAIWGSDDHAEMERAMAQTTAVAVGLVGFCSTLSLDEFTGVLHSRYERDLANKLTVFRILDDLVALWADQDPLNGEDPGGSAPPPPPSHPQLDWPDGAGPGYSAEAAQTALENRYAHLVKMTCRTRERLRGDPWFNSIVAELRSRGWLDWHIMNALFAVALTYRINRDVNAGIKSFADASRIPLGEDEPDDPVPKEVFTIDALLEARKGNDVTALVSTWSRSVHFRMVPFEAVEQLLAARYGHNTDDVAHENPFPNS